MRRRWPGVQTLPVEQCCLFTWIYIKVLEKLVLFPGLVFMHLDVMSFPPAAAYWADISYIFLHLFIYYTDIGDISKVSNPSGEFPHLVDGFEMHRECVIHRCSTDLLGRAELQEPLVWFNGDWMWHISRVVLQLWGSLLIFYKRKKLRSELIPSRSSKWLLAELS